MERKIGEIFKYNGEWYQCVNTGFSCADCDIKGNCSSAYIGSCSSLIRKDGKQVRFRKLEKVGEPYCFQKRIFQTYKLHTIPFLSEDMELVAIPSKGNNTIEIEIKQTKEDLEEKKKKLDDLVGLYSSAQMTYKEFDKELKALYTKHSNSEKIGKNLKPFSLEAAKSGKPVCTRNGHKARIICFDAKSSKPVIALITRKSDDYEEGYSFYEDGRACGDKNNDYDLMMLPEKKEGWVNVDKRSNGDVIISKPYPTRDEAIHNSTELTIDTVKIKWEE